MSISVVAIPVGPLETNAYLAVSGRESLVVDPGGDLPRIVQAVRRSGAAKIAAIVLTHGHFDHVGAAADLRRASGAPLLIHALDVPVYREASSQARLFGLPPVTVTEPDRTLAAGDAVGFGQAVLKVIHTPGHTPGGICLYGEGHLFSGDTLFAGSVGRTDLPRGNSAALADSLRNLLPLPDETQVHPGHGPSSTMGRERRVNPFLRTRR